MTKQTKYKNLNYKLELWDTAGQEKYRSLVKGYLKGADVCIFVYDVTSNFSLKIQESSHMRVWLNGSRHLSQCQATTLSR